MPITYKNIQIIPPEGIANEDVIDHPETNSGQVLMGDGKTLEQFKTEHLAENASTSKKGHVQLTDSVSSTSTTTAATPNSVKQAYDKANAAMPKTGGTFTGAVTGQNNTNYTTSQFRNIRIYVDGETVPVLANGEIAIIREP